MKRDPEKLREWKRRSKPLAPGAPPERKQRVKPVNRERRSLYSEKHYGTEDFRAWFYGLSCVVPGCEAASVEMAHVKSRGAGGTWQDVVPKCHAHHREQHDIGILTWQQKHGLCLTTMAAEIQRAWDNRKDDGNG